MSEKSQSEPSACSPWPAADAERYRALGLWTGERLFDALKSAAQLQPSKTAIVSADATISYADLFERSANIANVLQDHGMVSGDRLLVQLGNSEFFVCVVLACLQLGIQPVLALPAQRRHEIGHLVELAQCRAMVVTADTSRFDYVDMANTLQRSSDCIKKIFVDTDAGGETISLLDCIVSPDPDRRLAQSTATPSDTALYLLSGGTTGLPKLIPRTHDDYLLNARVASKVSNISKDTVYLVALPAAHNFPFACPGIIGTLLAGGQVIMAPSPAPDVAFALIQQHKVTITAVVPAVAMRWLEQDHSNAPLRTLQVLQVGGSRMPEQAARRVQPTLGCKLQQVFGMAEGLLNYTRLDDSVDVICTTQGRPACEQDEVRIVDDNGVDVGTDCVGHLMTRGPYTIRGYFKAPQHNAQSFDEQGYYLSGDLVRRRSDGNLVVEGRTKDVINRGGEKISAEELENFCLSLPCIRSVAAIAMPDPELGEDICVFVVTQPQQTLALAQLRQHLVDQGLAKFKLPAKLILLPELPTTNIGKIDKKSLREYKID